MSKPERSKVFKAIWDVIKPWSISRTESLLYHDASNDDVEKILEAIRPYLKDFESESKDS